VLIEFAALCESEGISVERTVPCAHWQLGRIERLWRTLTDGAKALLLYASLPERFWGQAFLTMIYIRNRCWSSGSNGIPLELVTGKRPNLSYLRVFGCPAFVHIDESSKRKLGDKAWKGVFVGYAFDSPAWIVYNPRTRKLIRSRSVVFNEAWMDPSRVDTPHILLPEAPDDEEEEMLPPLEIDTSSPTPTEAPAPSSPVSVLQQRELERITRISEAPAPAAKEPRHLAQEH